MQEIKTLPVEWLQELTDEEKEKYNQEIDRKVNKQLTERGFILPDNREE